MTTHITNSGVVYAKAFEGGRAEGGLSACYRASFDPGLSRKSSAVLICSSWCSILSRSSTDLRLVELLHELLLSRQQVLYDRTHKSPIARGEHPKQKSDCGHSAKIVEARASGTRAGPLSQNVRGGRWFLRATYSACRWNYLRRLAHTPPRGSACRRKGGSTSAARRGSQTTARRSRSAPYREPAMSAPSRTCRRARQSRHRRAGRERSRQRE